MLKQIIEYLIPLSLRRQIIQKKAWNFYESHPEFHKLLVRPETSDIFMFRQVFIREDYILPFSIPSGQIRRIIDGGANVGYASYWFHHQFPQADIIAIEPEPHNFTVLQNNTRGIARIQCLNKGLWSHQAHLEVIDEGYGECGFIVKETKKRTEHSIPATSIPDLMQQRKWKYVDIVKLDIEGSEYQLLSQNPTWIHQCRCIILELHEEMVPGVTKIFQQVFQDTTKWTIVLKGENFFILNNAFNKSHERSV